MFFFIILAPGHCVLGQGLQCKAMLRAVRSGVVPCSIVSELVLLRAPPYKTVIILVVPK